MTKFFRDFLRDESGAAAAEYVLILAIIGGGIAGAAYAFSGNLTAALNAKGDFIQACGESNDGSACQ